MALVFDPDSHRYTLDGVELPSVTHICRFLAYDYKSDKPWRAEAAARRGTAVHEACTLLDYGEEPEEHPEIAGYLNAYRRFLRDYQPEWEGLEVPLGSKSLGFAGTPDRWGKVDGKLTLLDIKTGVIHTPAVSAQLYGYLSLLLENGVVVARALALQLSNSGIYNLYETGVDAHLFRACMTLHNALKGRKP